MSDAGFITIQVSGLGDKRRRLATWGVKMETLAPAWEQVGDDLLADFGSQVLREGGTFGRASAWEPLRPATVRDRLRKGYGGAHPMEWRDGTLVRSLMFRDAPGNVFEVRPDGLTVGSSDPIAGYQHYGTSRMVARQLVGVSRRRATGIVARLNEYVQQQVRESGL